MRAARRSLVAALLAGGAFAVPVALAPGQEQVVVEPPQVGVRMFYRGSDVHVRARVPAGAEVAIALVGEERTVTLERKGKVLGLIWMNVGEVTFEAVPDVLLVRATCSLRGLAHDAVLKDLGPGLEALVAAEEPASAAEGTPDDSLLAELVGLKGRDGLWDVADGVVDLESTGDGYAIASTDFFLPARVPPGEYRVLVIAAGAGETELVGEGRIQVVQTGLAAFISRLARGHGLLYGILAVVVAAAAGLLTGVVFDLGSSKGH